MNARASFDKAAQDVCARQGLVFGGHVGSGAFKHTYRVTEGEVPKALKIYKSSDSRRIEREVSAIRRCNHSGIARLEMIDSFVCEGASYVFSVEEYLSGGTLTERLKHGPF